MIQESKINSIIEIGLVTCLLLLVKCRCHFFKPYTFRPQIFSNWIKFLYLYRILLQSILMLFFFNFGVLIYYCFLKLEYTWLISLKTVKYTQIGNVNEFLSFKHVYRFELMVTEKYIHTNLNFKRFGPISSE